MKHKIELKKPINEIINTIIIILLIQKRESDPRANAQQLSIEIDLNEY